MAFISLQDIFLSFGEHPLLDNVNLQIEQNQKICLLGRNGTGKSTLMKIMAGVLEPDSGRIITDQKINITYFEQDFAQLKKRLVFDVIAEGFKEHTNELMQYFREDVNIRDGRTFPDLKIERVHTPENWDRIQRIRRIAQDVGVNCTDQYDNLSGGQKRRTILAASLVSQPDLLLLDEPTNHLDIDTIIWMEEYILKFCPTVLFVTHDRAFLKKIATRIIELDRGILFDYHCSYETFLERKQAYLDAQEKEWADFDKKLSEEEEWLRKGIKARRTRNEGRVRALFKMREAKKERRLIQGKAKLEIGLEQKSGRIVIEADNLSFAYPDKSVINNFSTIISRGDKIGILGPNGCGKTTLVNLLIGRLKPASGTLKLGTNISLAFYDQMREEIDVNKSIHENVQPNGDTVFINGRSKHIIGYLQDFLFSPERSRSPVSQLSGGERNRLILAKLFTQPCNLLVMDEPTNDLDAETLELLEDLIVEFDGTVLIISHDRMFLNNTTSSLFVFKDSNEIIEITGGYDDWISYKAKIDEKAQAGKRENKINYKEQKSTKQKTKLTFKEQKELDELPDIIEGLESAIEKIHEEMSKPEFYLEPDKIKNANKKLEELEKSLRDSYKRWEEIEEIKNSLL